MPSMTDMMPALQSYQAALSADEFDPPPSRAFTDDRLHLFTDIANGKMRLTYSRVDDDGIVTAFLSVLLVEPLDGMICVAVGYAVPEQFRGQGRATEILSAVVKELSHGFHQGGHKGIAIEAVISVDNAASIAVARKVLSETPKEIKDSVSGLPALQFVRKITF